MGNLLDLSLTEIKKIVRSGLESNNTYMKRYNYILGDENNTRVHGQILPNIHWDDPIFVSYENGVKQPSISLTNDHMWIFFDTANVFKISCSICKLPYTFENLNDESTRMICSFCSIAYLGIFTDRYPSGGWSLTITRKHLFEIGKRVQKPDVYFELVKGEDQSILVIHIRNFETLANLSIDRALIRHRELFEASEPNKINN